MTKKKRYPGVRVWHPGPSFKRPPKAGKRIWHTVFGCGEVICSHPTAMDYYGELVIRFDGCGKKTLLWAFSSTRIRSLRSRLEHTP